MSISTDGRSGFSAYLPCYQLSTCPWNLCQCFSSLVAPCPEGQSLLGRCLCGIFSWLPNPALCIAETCVGFSWFPKPVIWSGPLSVGFLWPEKCSFLCNLPSRSLLCPVFWDSIAPPWPTYKGDSQCMGTLPPSRLPPSLGGQASILNFSVSSPFMSASSLLPHSRELILPPWRPGVFFVT